MIPSETKLSKVIGIPFALACIVVMFIGKIVFFLWKMLCAPAKWVVRAFLDLAEDETHLDKIRERMKGG